MSNPSAPGPGPTAATARVEDVLALVRARGGRVTVSRRVLLEILFEGRSHVTAEELAAAVQARLPSVNRSTIYRNLDDLQRLGVVVHSHLGHGPATYHLASASHAHLLCEACGLTIEAPDDMFAGLSRAAKSRLGFSVDTRHFAIVGRCATCA